MKYVNEKICSLLICLLLVAGLLTVPQTASAATKVPQASSSIKYKVSAGGKLSINWSAVSGAKKYILTRVAPGGSTKHVYEGTALSFAEKGLELTKTGSYTYYVQAQNSAGTGAKKSLSLTYVKPNDMYISHDRLTINKNKTRQLHISWGIKSPGLTAYQNTPLGKWKSSDTKIATVTQSGKVKAISPGTCQVSYNDVAGYHKTCQITVPAKANAAGSIYIENLKYPNMQTLLANDVQTKGRQNRLNGTIRSEYKIKKLYVRVYNAKTGVRELAYSKKINKKSYDLTRLNNAIKFKNLKKGQKVIKVWATNSKGKVKLYETTFTVGSAPAKADKGAEIVKWGLTRRGDPYSQALRGTLNYSDCSWFARWCYQQGANVSLPYTAATQYKYCVTHKKTVKKSELKAGDLIFYGGWKNGRYKGIYHVAVYMGNGMIVHTGTPVHVRKMMVRSKMYYGRPY